MKILRVESPNAPAFKFPQLKLSSTSVGGEDTYVDSEAQRYASMGWEVVDEGKQENYHVDTTGTNWGLYTAIPNGFHFEPPTASWNGGNTPQEFCAIVPDGKTRKDVGA